MSIYDEDTWFDDGDYDDVGDEMTDEEWEEFVSYDDLPTLTIRIRLEYWFYSSRLWQLINRFRTWRQLNDEEFIPY